MSDFATNLLPKIKLTLREASSDFDEEIISYIEECVTDLQNVHILSHFFDPNTPVDPQILRAIRWYCLSVYGLYNADMEKYDRAYRSLKATLATQRKYTVYTVSPSELSILGQGVLGTMILGKAV
jgi:hypothetical protein